MATKPATQTTRVQPNADTGIPGFGSVPPAPVGSPAATGNADGKPKRGKKSTLTPEQAAAKQRERRDRFLKYAAKRVNGILRRLKQVKALANKAGYEYTPEEAKKICEAIGKASDDVEQAFAGAKDKANEFSL